MESDDKKKEEIVKVATSMEFYPVEAADQSKSHKGYKKIPLTEISGLGSMFAEMVPSLRTVTTTTTAHVEGLYKCTFPDGVKGTLAQFKDGSGSLGTIMNNNKIVGQARWNPAGSVSATQSVVAPISPVSMFMAAANAGKFIHGIPVIEKGPVDDFLTDAGKKVGDFNKNRTTKMLEKFCEKNDSGAKQFENEIRNISRQYNSPMEILVDKDNVYIKLGDDHKKVSK